jgi:hypothetical protein
MRRLYQSIRKCTLLIFELLDETEQNLGLGVHIRTCRINLISVYIDRLLHLLYIKYKINSNMAYRTSTRN